MPQYEIVNEWDRQPQEYADINWANPLTNGMVSAWHGGDPSVEQISKRLRFGGDNPSLMAIRPTEFGGSQGTSVASDNISSDFRCTRTTQPASEFTMACLFRIRNLPAGNRNIVTFGNQSGEGAFITVTTTGLIRGSTIRANTTVDSNTTYAAGSWIFAIYTAREGAFNLWVNGVKQTASNTGTLSSFQARDFFSIRSSDAETVFFVPWNRALSDSEVSMVFAEPWRIYERRELVISPAATSGISLLPSGIPSSETFGTAAITRGNVSILTTGIVSAESFGTHVIGVAGGPQILSPTGIASAMAFGSPQIALGSSGIVVPGVGSGEAFGTPTIGRGLITVIPSGIASAQMFGTPGVLKGTLVIYPGGIPSGESFGIPALVGGTAVETQAVFYVRGFSAFGSRRNS